MWVLSPDPLSPAMPATLVEGWNDLELPPGSAHPPASLCCVLPTALASHDYILKIVPTVYEDRNGKQRYSYQYTVASKVRAAAAGRRRAAAPSAGRAQRLHVSGAQFEKEQAGGPPKRSRSYRRLHSPASGPQRVSA